jgi:hypothetical protein
MAYFLVELATNKGLSREKLVLFVLLWPTAAAV